MGNIMVSGAGGFLGHELIIQCLGDTDFEIYALTSQKQKLKEQFGDNKKFHIVDWDCNFDDGISDQTVLVNCAYPRNTDGVRVADGLYYISDLLQKSVQAGISAVINISSQSVYGQYRKSPATETSILNLETKYAVGKYATELLTNAICNVIPHTNIRLASLFGIGFEQRFTNKMVQQCISGSSLQIVSGQQMYEFLDVRDAANAIIRMTNSRFCEWEDVYNIGSSHSYTLKEIASMIAIIGEEYTDEPISIIVDGEGKQENSSIDCSKFKNQFNWTSNYQFSDTIKDMFEHYCKKGIS